jgi:hypothetical protein
MTAADRWDGLGPSAGKPVAGPVGVQCLLAAVQRPGECD